MNRMRKKVLFSLIVLIPLFTLSQEPEYRFEELTMNNGLSNNRVYSIIQDKKGFLWIGTLDGLNRYDGYNFKVYRNQPKDSSSISNNRATIIYEDNEGYLWIVGKNTGINKFDPGTETFKSYIKDPEKKGSLPDNEISDIYESVDNQLLFEAKNLTFAYNRENETFSVVKRSNKESRNKIPPDIKALILNRTGKDLEITCSMKDRKGNTWVGITEKGLFRISPDKNVSHFPLKNLINNQVNTILEDKYGIIWIGTNNTGILKYNPSSEKFGLYRRFENKSSNIEKLIVRSFTKDTDGNYWIGTYSNGLIKLNARNNTFEHFKHTPSNDKNGIPGNKIRALHTDKDGNVWVGCYKGLSRYKKNTRQFERFSLHPDENDSLQDPKDYRVYSIAEDYYGNLWIANWENLIKLNRKTQEIEIFPKEKLGMDNIRVVYIDKNNLMWIGAEFGGLAKVNLLGEEIDNFTKKYNKKLTSENIFDIYEDRNGLIWVATFNGLNTIDKETNKVTHITSANGLASNMTYGLLEDNNGFLWVTTSNGLSRININDFSVLNFNDKHGLQSNEFTEGAHYINAERNEILIGGVDGFNIFNPDKITANAVKPDIVLTSFKILNKEIKPRQVVNKNIPIKQSIEYTNELKLTHRDKIITFEFSGIHFKSPDNNKYAYMLEGFDNEWVTTEANRRYATYTNLNPGHYTFRVKAANCDNIWNEEGVRVVLVMLPPFWETWYAYVVYGVVFLFMLILFRKAIITRYRMKNSLKLERLEREKSDELNQLKLQFFTNISHEFRTTLSLILGPLNEIYKVNNEKPISTVKKQLNIMNRSTVRLFELINQILDFRKMESNGMKLKARKTEIIDFTHNIYVYYKELAARKNLKLKFEKECDSHDIWIDREKYEKIIANLLSNAVKYTPTEGKIQIILTDTNNSKRTIQDKDFYQIKIGKLPHKNDYFEISVTDTGRGIPNELLESIFHRFYQIDSYSLDEKGTGIGLALVKEMVDMHKGEILVRSVEGEGSCFCIRLPKGKHHLKEDQLVIKETPKPVIQELPQNKAYNFQRNELSDNSPETKKDEKTQTIALPEGTPQILLVDDNEDFRSYLKDLLSASYIIHEACNGTKALLVAKEKFPDLIISDIMMPEMDGNEFCRNIKTDISTSHIPVILLTAKANNESMLEGLDNGADIFLTKPIQTDILLARIKNILELKNRLREYHSKKIIAPKKSKDEKPNQELSLTEYDEKFLKKAIKLVEKNISNSEFSVELMSRELGLSRSSLHNKLKALTNQSSTEFIRSIRLKNAVSCMKKGNMNIVEISYNVGFNTPSYFIKCFKKQFGVTPKEYFSKINQLSGSD